MTQDEEKYLNDLIVKGLSVSSDEKEGQQVINLNDLDLCAVDYESTGIYDSSYDMNILKNIFNDEDLYALLLTSDVSLPNILNNIHTNNHIILEFADATVNDPNPVEYKIFVNPGDQINSETIIGTVIQKGEEKQIKSIFDKGTVAAINDNTEFKRLYPSNCNRHIILEDTLEETGEMYDLSNKIQELNDKFTKEGILYSLITNNLCQSLLPVILSRRYRGVYTRTFNGYNYSKWYLDTSDLIVDNTEISTYIQNKDFKGNKQYDTEYFIYDFENESKDTGLKIFDASILKIVNEYQDEFGANIIGTDITKDDVKSWKKRAKKKRKRKKVKQEIKDKIQHSVDNIKHSENPYNVLNEEKDRLLNSRNSYIDKIIQLYKDRDKLPLCKFDPEYNDCKFLVNDKIDSHVLENVKNYDEEFTYSAIGDVDNYYNYYKSLLGNIILLNEDADEYTKEYYNLISDIINKRIIVEGTPALQIKKDFMKLFNDNVSEIFKLYTNEKFNTEEHINHQFNKFENMINIFVQEQKTKYANNLYDQFSKAELGDEFMVNTAELYTDNNKYKQIYDYIKSLYAYDSEEDESCPNEIVSQLATMYTYIKSYGDGSNNIYKDIKTEDDKYLYYKLILEESQKITNFWDKIILLYEECKMSNCINDLDNLSNSFDKYAEWPTLSFININNVDYQHYLFTNIYKKDPVPVDISIGDYAFPETVDFPEIPSDVSVDENWAIEQLNNHEVEESKQNPVTILDFEYWQKYFTLATLICLVPTCWNCGLDIPPFIYFIQLPCIFIAIKSIHIPIFNMVIVFGLAIRGMYPWPIILYLNTSDSPISVLTPLVAIVNRLKTIFKQKINQVQNVPVKNLAEFYINKLNTEINDIKKENIKLDTYKRAIKHMKMPNANYIGKQFAKIVNPNVDTRQKITRLETLVRKSRAN